MSQTLRIKNFSTLNILEDTTLLDDVAAGVSTIPVVNNQNFVANGYFIIGRLSSDTAELLTVNSTIGVTTVISNANTVRAHTKHEDVHMLYGDKIRIYRAPNVDGSPPADGTYSMLAELDIDYDQSSTSYTDASGDDTFWYKSVYYNSTLDTETALVSSSALRGGSYGNYATIDSIRNQAGLQNNRYITDAKIEEKRQAAQSYINSTLTGRYTVPFSRPINPLVSEMTRLLAAGYLLTQEIGTTNVSTYREGQAMIDRVYNADGTGLLDRLNVGELSLLDETGVSTELSSSSSSYGGWPNSTTEDAAMFKVSDVY